MTGSTLPIPPLTMRLLVGGPPIEAFENPTGRPVLADVPVQAYDAVLDFGSACGRVARQMILQTPRPRAYLGLDLHPGMVEWCRDHPGHQPRAQLIVTMLRVEPLRPCRTHGRQARPAHRVQQRSMPV